MKEKEFKMRLAAAKEARRDIHEELRESYKFLFNGRARDFESRYSAESTEDIGDLFTELPAELAVDFATDICDFYAPDTAAWIEFEYQEQPEWPEQVRAQAREIVENRESDILGEVASSNFYTQCHTAAKEAAHGTMAMWISRDILGEPVWCEPVPANELYIGKGLRGIEDRFWARKIRASGLPTMFEGVDFPDKIRRKIEKNHLCEVIWGFWIDRTDPQEPMWVEHATIDGTHVHQREAGPWKGGCPLLVGRVNPESSNPWGRGPMRVGLPAARVLDEIEAIFLEKMDQVINPSWAYPSDGVLDLSKGLSGGTAYPMSPGSGRDIMELASKANLDAGFFEKAQIEDRLRQVFFQDGPRQRGDTPPTATQWLDELRATQRRIGRPTSTLWSEFFVHVIYRFEQLMVEAGKLDAAITVAEDIINVAPVSPLIKAQRQDEAMVGRSLLDTAQQTFGEQTPVVVDGYQTFQNLKDRMGDTVVVMRSPEEIANAAQTA